MLSQLHYDADAIFGRETRPPRLVEIFEDVRGIDKKRLFKRGESAEWQNDSATEAEKQQYQQYQAAMAQQVAPQTEDTTCAASRTQNQPIVQEPEQQERLLEAAGSSNSPFKKMDYLDEDLAQNHDDINDDPSAARATLEERCTSSEFPVKEGLCQEGLGSEPTNRKLLFHSSSAPIGAEKAECGAKKKRKKAHAIWQKVSGWIKIHVKYKKGGLQCNCTSAKICIFV